MKILGSVKACVNSLTTLPRQSVQDQAPEVGAVGVLEEPAQVFGALGAEGDLPLGSREPGEFTGRGRAVLEVGGLGEAADVEQDAVWVEKAVIVRTRNGDPVLFCRHGCPAVQTPQPFVFFWFRGFQGLGNGR